MDFILKTIKILAPGLQSTITLFGVTIILSLPLGMLLALVSAEKKKTRNVGRYGSNKSKLSIRVALVRLYVFIIRGTPLMLQLFFIYFGLPFIPIIGKYMTYNRMTAASIAFIINYSAYFCEIFRGGLLSIDQGQEEAAKVLGLNRIKTTLYIRIPQMLKVSLPPVSNETITLIKDTALATTIGVIDLMHLTKARVNSTANVMPFAVAAVFYLLLTFVLTKLFSYLERRFEY